MDAKFELWSAGSFGGDNRWYAIWARRGMWIPAMHVKCRDVKLGFFIIDVRFVIIH